MSVSVKSSFVNLFYDVLPKTLQDYVYSYDGTYHNVCLKEDVKGGYFQLKAVRQKAEYIIGEWLLEKARQRTYWTNSWLLMDNGLWMEDEEHYKEWQDHSEVFKVHFIVKDARLYFKLMPLGVPYRQSYGVDGFFQYFDTVNDDYEFVPVYGAHNGHIYMYEYDPQNT
jgi:hypothetical protein